MKAIFKKMVSFLEKVQLLIIVPETRIVTRPIYVFNDKIMLGQRKKRFTAKGWGFWL